MYLSLLIFCTCGIVNADVSGDSDDEGKFIDLLPEEEKNAFIESVARRLLPGVKTRDSRYKSDEALSDEELNQHSEFVRKILEEETNNLRRGGKINKDSDEKLKVKGLDRDIEPIQIPDDDDKNHIDLTLRGHRRKRNEKEIHNEELIIPVKTVYDDFSERSTNKTLNKDGNQDVNTKSKERADENSTTEDIQVRGPRPNSRGLKQAKTVRPILRDATVIADFEPEESNENMPSNETHDAAEESNEHFTSSNETREDASTDNLQSKTHAPHKVTKSAETNDDVELSHSGFTQSIFESPESEKERNSHSKESIEAVTTSTSVATEITVVITTNPPTTTTHNVVTETSTVQNQSQNTTDNRQYLRANFDNVEKEKESESYLDEMKNVNNNSNSNEKSEEKAATNITVITSEANVVMKDSIVKLNNENLDSLSNNTNLRTGNKNDTSYEQDYSLKNKSNVGNDDDYLKTNKIVEKDVIVSNIDIKSKTEASQSTLEPDKHEFTKERDQDKKSDNYTANIEKNKEYTEDFGKSRKIKNSDIEYSAEDKKSNDSISFVAATENNKLRDKVHYATKEVNGSYILNNVNNLRSDTVNNITDKEIVETDQKTTIDSNKSLNIDDMAYKQSQGILGNRNNILTTTEKAYEIRSKNNTNVPNYKIFYSSYIPDKTEDSDNAHKSENNLNHKEEGEFNYKKVKNIEYESQKSNLEKIEKTLRQGFSQEEDKDELEETKLKLLQSRAKIKEYLVYEIPADQTPFVLTKRDRKKKPKPKEIPYYVSVYKYSPNNVHNNAYNRLGSNEEENYEILENYSERNDDSSDNFSPEYVENFYIDNLKQLDGHRIFKYNSKKHKKNREKSREIHNSNSFGLPLMTKKPKVTGIYFNPDEYLDMNYYFERSRNTAFRNWNTQRSEDRKDSMKELRTKDSPFPDSDEQSHPFHSMAKDGINSHMSAVRQMLFQKQLFGFVPAVTSPKPMKNKIKIKDNPKNYEDNNDNNDHKQHKHNKPNIQNNYSDPNIQNDTNADDQDYDYDDGNVTLFRAFERLSDHIILLPSDEPKNDYSNQQDISVDYYFGIYNTENDPEGSRYEDFRRVRGDKKPNIKIVYKKNREMLTDLIGDIKSRSKGVKNKETPKELKKRKNNTGTIRDILAIADTNDLFPTLEKLRKLKLPLMRRKDKDDTIEVFVNVLKDMIKMENRALNTFDWLGSTVDVLGAVAKLKYMTEPPTREELHPSDWQLLKYVLLLYKSSKSSLEDSVDEEQLLRAPRKKHNALPRNRNRKKQYLSTGLLNRVWLYIRDRDVSYSEKKRRNRDFLQFLDDLKDSLFDLYNALKHIAMVTKYKNQQWFQNLKSLYLKKAGKKEMLELLLHIFTSRLLELIEESALNGVEEGYLDYVKHNEKQVQRTKEDFVFVLKLLDEIKKLNKEDDLDFKIKIIE